jgi:hypothetical protein
VTDNRRRHDQPSGRRPGPPLGTVNAVVKHGQRSGAFVLRRKEVNALLRQCSAAVRASRDPQTRPG